VIVLDENVFESQRVRLMRRRTRLCQIGLDVGRKGMPDKAIIPLLRTLRRPTFVTSDDNFFEKSLCDGRYCLVHFHVAAREIAEYVLRLFRHADFKTWSQRRERVLSVSTTAIKAWALREPRARRFKWPD
jgi:hypothetical protein